MKIKKRPVRTVDEKDNESEFNVLRYLFKVICDKRGIKEPQLSKLASKYALKVNGGVSNAVSQYMKVNVINNITKPSITYKMFLIAMAVLEVKMIRFRIEVEFKNGDKVDASKDYPLKHDKVLVVNNKEKEDDTE